jgi:predicted alpha/beta-fold hydrolase
MPDSSFEPGLLLRNPHIQSILSSTQPRKLLVKRRARALLDNARDMVLDCGHGVRLIGHYTPARGQHDKGLVTLIHGWEGSSESNYILSLASRLYAEGFGIFRLNLRDHGPSHHLNRELFNSTRLEEVLGAMEAIQAQLDYAQHFLAGFSLGGNFSLRIGADAAGRDYSFDKIIAVCPVVSPPHTMDTLENGFRLYHDYFVHKWKRSLYKKAEHFPEYPFRERLAGLKNLRQMNHYFVPNYTDFDDSHSYLSAYAIAGDRLGDLRIPAHIITSADDPVCHVEDFKLINKPPALSLEITRYGGHCGFIENLRLHSWIDRRILQLLQSDRHPS